MRKLILALAIALFAPLVTASAQETPTRRAGPEERAVFLPLCHRLITERDAGGISEYCGAAAQLLFNIHVSEGQTPNFSQEEVDSLLEAAWANGVNGINHIDRGRPIEFVPMGDEADNLRIGAYAMLAALRRGSGRDVGGALSHLMFAIDVRPANRATLVVARRQAITELASRPHTPERTLAIVSLALSVEFGLPEMSTAELDAEAQFMLDQLQRLNPNIESQSALDVVLPSLFAEAIALAQYKLRNFSASAEGYDAAARACATQAWAEANICMNMRFDAARARFRAQEQVEHPELAGAPDPDENAPFTNPEPNVRTPCRVVTVVDIADDGSILNPRVIHEDPPGVCTAISQAYVASRRFTPASQAAPGERRINVMVKLERRSP